MCTSARFQYHFGVEATLVSPAASAPGVPGRRAKSSWAGALARVRELLLPLVKDNAAASVCSCRRMASHESSSSSASSSARPGRQPRVDGGRVVANFAKAQPAGSKFQGVAVDAPNVAGARAMGFRVPEGADAACDISGFLLAVESGAVKALYVVDPGPEGSLGDVSWVIDARASGKLPCSSCRASR